MCGVRHPVVQILRKKLFELQMRSGIDGREDAWLCGGVVVAGCEVAMMLEAEGPDVDRSVKRCVQRRHLTLTLTPHHHNRT